MKISVLISIVLVLALYGCDKMTVGNLKYSNVGYSVDSIEFKTVLNPDDEEDAEQIRLERPFSTGELQGIDGTLPIYYMIRKIECDNDAAEIAMQQFCIVGKGRIQLPFNHTVPIGRYVFYLRIENEDHYLDTDSILTIIVK